VSEKHFYDTVIPVTLKPWTDDPSDTNWGHEMLGPNLSQTEDLAIGLGKIHSWYANFSRWVFNPPAFWHIPVALEPLPVGDYSEYAVNYISTATTWDLELYSETYPNMQIGDLIMHQKTFALATHAHTGIKGYNIDTSTNWIIDDNIDECIPEYADPSDHKDYLGEYYSPGSSNWSSDPTNLVHPLVGIHMLATNKGACAHGELMLLGDNDHVFFRSSLGFRGWSGDVTWDTFNQNWHACIRATDITCSDSSMTLTPVNYNLHWSGEELVDGKKQSVIWSKQVPVGITISHTNSVTAQQTAGLYKVAYDANGHITSTTAVAKADITALGIPGSDTDTKVTQTAVTDVSTYTSYRPLIMSNASYQTKPFTPATTTAGTIMTPNIYCQPSSGVIWTTGRGLTAFAIQTDSTTKKSIIDLETLMAWLITNKYIPSGVYAHIVLTTTWSYADNDYLLFTANGENYQIFLAGCTIEFTGYATSYNTGVFRLVIHTAPHRATGVTPTQGYTLLDAAQVLEYWCNGSAYSPVWKIYSTRTDIGSAGSTTCPVYFSAGKPLAVTQPTSGAWWSSVPKIDASGVLEIGKYIDFHATATSTNNYDYRIYASVNSLVLQSSNSTYTNLLLTSSGYGCVRFETSASGKACSSAAIYAYPLTTSGQVLLMQSGGNTVIGAGEFATNAYTRKDSTGTDSVGYDNLATAENEDLYLGADTDVHIISNGQNIGTYSNTDHKEWLFAANGVLTSPDYIKISKNSAGLLLTDKNNAEFGGVWYNGSNFWLGATQTNTHHHVGGTYISTGYDATNSVGNSTVKIVVPNAANNGGTTYDLIHTGNKSLLNDTYVPLAGGSMNNDVTLIFPRASGGATRITNQGFNIQVANSTGFARAITVYRGDWSTILGQIGFYGSASATAADVEYYMGDDYISPWYSFKKTQFTVKGETNFKIDDSNDAGWSLVYKSSVLSMDGQVISCYPSSSQYGCGIIIGESSGGLTIIGGGEAARSLKNTIMDSSTTPYSSAKAYDSEDLIMAADTDLYFVCGANTLTTSAHTEGTNLKTFIWSNAGTLRPWNDNTYSIGASSKRWNYGYFTNISGKLIGTIDSTTTGVTQNVLSSVDSSTKIATTQFAWRLKHRAGTFYNNSTSWNSATWGNVASVKYSTSGNLYLTTVFLITSNYKSSTGARSGIGILFVQFYATNTALVNYRLKWVYSDDIINNETVVVTHTADTSTSTPFSEIGIWVKCDLARYQSISVSEIHEMNLSSYVGSSTWNLYGLTSGVASYPTGNNVTRMMPDDANVDQPLLYTSSAATTYVECSISDLFFKWKAIYVCIQNSTFKSGSSQTNATNYNFVVPLQYVKKNSRYGQSGDPGYYVGEGFNPSNTGTSSSATRMLVQWVNDGKIRFTHQTDGNVGIIRIYGLY